MIAPRLLAGLLAALASGSCAQQIPSTVTVPPSSAAAERPVYELRVTAYGSRSQGIRGVLFNADGSEVSEDGAGQMADTPLGRFRYVDCQYLWSVCGYFRDGAAVAAYPGPPLNPSRSEVIVWRLSLVGQGAAAHWRSRLIDNHMAAVAAPVGQTILDTPLGAFRSWRGALNQLDGEGAVAAGWPEVAAGRR